MAKKNNSILNETNFSHFNLRDSYINEYVEYASTLRDEIMFSNYGILVNVRIPLVENDVDEYSNYVDDYLTGFSESTETVVPLFKEYRQNVSVEGMSADGTDGLYPLEVLIPSKLHLPRNSRIIFNEYNSNQEQIAREWMVLGTQMKQLSNSKTYTRVANCVPARKLIQKAFEIGTAGNSGTLYSIVHPVELVKKEGRWSQTTLYAVYPPIKLVKTAALHPINKFNTEQITAFFVTKSVAISVLQ